jgi:hypothetical protein
MVAKILLNILAAIFKPINSYFVNCRNSSSVSLQQKREERDEIVNRRLFLRRGEKKSSLPSL